MPNDTQAWNQMIQYWREFARSQEADYLRFYASRIDMMRATDDRPQSGNLNEQRRNSSMNGTTKSKADGFVCREVHTPTGFKMPIVKRHPQNFAAELGPNKPVIKATPCCGQRILHGIQDYRLLDKHFEELLWWIVWQRAVIQSFGAMVYTAIEYSSNGLALYGLDQDERFEKICAEGDRFDHGDRLRTFVEQAGFGEVDPSEMWYNPNSDNIVRTYTWRITGANHSAIVKAWNDSGMGGEFSHN